jgi:hypothetical protein
VTFECDRRRLVLGGFGNLHTNLYVYGNDAYMNHGSTNDVYHCWFIMVYVSQNHLKVNIVILGDVCVHGASMASDARVHKASPYLHPQTGS